MAEKCLICNKLIDSRVDNDNNYHSLCHWCGRQKIREEGDYIADQAEKELVKGLIRLEDLLT